MKPQPSTPKPHSEIQIVRLIWLAIFVSVFSFLFYNRQGDVLLYGDAVAHINIARRVFDSKTPGLLQLGTVWLPLPHLLILPFIVSNKMWQSGTGGSIPSMVAYVLGVLGIFRLMRTMLSWGDAIDDAAKVGAWAAAILYGANPNLIYMQSTAMGESVYLSFFIWAVVYFEQFVEKRAEKASQSLTKCGLCLAAACLTRYDGWFFAAIVVFAVLMVSARQLRVAGISKISVRRTRVAILRFVLISATAPVLWLAYNAAVYRNPLEFANGPYSAKAIAQKTATVNPAKDNLFTASSYFLKAAELNVSESGWLQRLWIFFALAGIIATAITGRRRVALLLLAPLPFYALSIAYGSVPIFVPTWWPFSHYNVRYGLQLLPAFACFVPLGVSFLLHMAFKVLRMGDFWRGWAGAATLGSVLLLAIMSYSAIWRADPICYIEAKINSRGRVALDGQVGNWITSLPPDSTLLMYLGEHVGALEQAGIPLSRGINEGNHRTWRQPADPDGLWERALANPSNYADYVVGFEGDPAWKAAEEWRLTALVEIHTTGQPRAAIFQGRAQHH